MVTNFVEILSEAENIREKAAGGVSGDIEQIKSLYFQAVDKVKTITESVTLEELNNSESSAKIGVGQAFWTIATIYTSLAKHGAKNDQEIRDFLDLAKQQLDNPLFISVLPEMEKINKMANGNPVLWKSEVARINARIEERQPQVAAENISKAISYYNEATETAYRAYFSALKDKNRPLQLGALSAYTTALGEKARIRPSEDKLTALTEMATVMGTLYGIYPELTDFDRLETVTGRVISYCVQNNIPQDNPVYRQACLLYLDLAGKTEDKNRFKMKLEQIEKLDVNLPLEFLEALKII